MSRVLGWLDRIRVGLIKPLPLRRPNWWQLGILGAYFLCSRLYRWRREDSFDFWLDVGMTAFVLAIVSLMLLIEAKKPQSTPAAEGSQSSRPGGIDVWMPLSLFALLLVGIVVAFAASK
jgi:hypothetical protein